MERHLSSMVAGSRDRRLEPVPTGSRARWTARSAASRLGSGGGFACRASPAIWVATALLFAVGPLLAPGSDSRSALLSMLPFAAILAIAAIGQTLVIQQRGLDLSVPGMITLTTIIVTKSRTAHDDRSCPGDRA